MGHLKNGKERRTVLSILQHVQGFDRLADQDTITVIRVGSDHSINEGFSLILQMVEGRFGNGFNIEQE